MALPAPHREAVRRLAAGLDGVPWALTGSASFALQGVPVDPGDVDVQTSADGAYAVADAFPGAVVDPVSYERSARVRSHLGALELAGVRVEVMGGLSKRRPDGTWGPATDVRDHREWVELGDRRVPVLSLSYEAEAYERLGRDERAALLRSHAGE